MLALPVRAANRASNIGKEAIYRYTNTEADVRFFLGKTGK